VIEEILGVLVEKEALDRECEGDFDVAVMVTVKGQSAKKFRTVIYLA
jgi:hypothetical protein